MAWNKPTPDSTSVYPGKKEEIIKKPGILSRIGSGIKRGVRYVAPTVKSAIKSGAYHGKRIAKSTGRQVSRGGRFVGHEVKQEVKRVAKKKIKHGVRIISGESQESRRRYQPYRRRGGRP